MILNSRNALPCCFKYVFENLERIEIFFFVQCRYLLYDLPIKSEEVLGVVYWSELDLV